MAVDWDRYNRLRESASFNCEFFRGHIQDCSKSRLAMSFVGAPSWTMVNGLPALRQNANGDRAESAAVAALVDVTGPFFVELLTRVDVPGVNYTMRQIVNGGFTTYRDTSPQVRLLLYTNAGAIARHIIVGAVGANPDRVLQHIIVGASGGGTVGIGWTNGVPTAISYAGAGVAASSAAAVVSACGGNTGRNTTLIARVWQGTPTNEDATCLYQAAKSLIGEV
jgi:hypothetical protein